jgi:uroporphyrin-III C-methyltransferase
MGKVYLVGAGPGAPDLLTLRAARLLETADLVLHDALVHPETLALARRARRVAVGKRHGRVSTDQRFIDRLLVEAARHHDVVVRLKGGDPMLFGRAQEELAALEAAGIEVEVVPGVTAALAAAATLRVSLTRRGLSRSVAFLTPRVGQGEGRSEWLAAALASDSIALYMAAGQSDAIAAALIAGGKAAATPVALVENASLPDERTSFATLAELAATPARSAEGPVLMLAGDVLSGRAERSSPDRSESDLPLSFRTA